MSEPTPLLIFLSGAIAAGFVVAAVFLLRFWIRTRDGLFLAFAAAFGLLGLGQILLTLADVPDEERSWLFLLRLAAFVVIIGAVVRKNRQ